MLDTGAKSGLGRIAAVRARIQGDEACRQCRRRVVFDDLCSRCLEPVSNLMRNEPSA
jgi:hypothetical protein